MLEELGLPYRAIAVDIGKGEQFDPEVPEDQPQQQDSGDRRPRQRPSHDGVGRHPAVSGGEDRRQAGTGLGRPPLDHDGVADDADGARRSHAGADAPLREIQRRQGSLCRGALPQGESAYLRGARQAPCRS